MQPTMTSLPMMSFLDTSTSSLIATTLDSTIQQPPPQMDEAPIIIEQLSPTTTLIVFIIGIIPFIWATIEFWRRIAVGLPFGTGKDSILIRPEQSSSSSESENVVTIGEDNNPRSSRGRQVLGKGAIVVAYILFGVAAFSVGIAVFSVVTSDATFSNP